MNKEKVVYIRGHYQAIKEKETTWMNLYSIILSAVSQQRTGGAGMREGQGRAMEGKLGQL